MNAPTLFTATQILDYVTEGGPPEELDTRLDTACATVRGYDAGESIRERKLRKMVKRIMHLREIPVIPRGSWFTYMTAFYQFAGAMPEDPELEKKWRMGFLAGINHKSEP